MSVWDGIADEFLHLYPRGSRLLAVAGADASRSDTAAKQLTAVFAAKGIDAAHVHTVDGNEAQLRADVIEPFRAERPEQVLVVSGPANLLAGTTRGLWHSTVWQLTGDEPAQTAASAIVDFSDPAHPTRRFADFCAVMPGGNC